jgi:hypothetical protein
VYMELSDARTAQHECTYVHTPLMFSPVTFGTSSTFLQHLLQDLLCICAAIMVAGTLLHSPSPVNSFHLTTQSKKN